MLPRPLLLQLVRFRTASGLRSDFVEDKRTGTPALMSHDAFGTPS